VCATCAWESRANRLCEYVAGRKCLFRKRRVLAIYGIMIIRHALDTRVSPAALATWMNFQIAFILRRRKILYEFYYKNITLRSSILESIENNVVKISIKISTRDLLASTVRRYCQSSDRHVIRILKAYILQVLPKKNEEKRTKRVDTRWRK